MNKTKKNWKCFFDKYETVRENFRLGEQKNASGFNIFEVLDIERMERETHSAFLANLLDPYGSHGQGALFLIQFFEYVKAKIERQNKNKECFTKEIEAIHDLIKAAKIKSQFKAGDWHITTEKHIVIGNDFGKLDLVIQHIGTKNTIIIENKIDSIDNLDQLKKYSKWRDALQKTEKCIGILFYLTLYGSKSKVKKPITLTKYHCLSYEEDIIVWLTNAKGKCLAPRTRDILEQYLASIGKITGELIMTDQNLAKFLKNDNYLRFALEISNEMEKLKPEIEYLFWSSIKEGLENKLKIDATGKNWEVWMSNKKDLKNNWFGVKIIQKRYTNHIEVFCISCWRYDQNCYFGIRTPGKDWKIPSSKNKDKLLDKLMEMGLNKKRNTTWVLGCAKLPGLKNSIMDINSLVEINKNPGPLACEVVDELWKLFKKTHKLVSPLNELTPQQFRK